MNLRREHIFSPARPAATEAEHRVKQSEHRKRVRTAFVAVAVIVLLITAVLLVEANVSHSVAYGLMLAIATCIAAVLAYEILGLGTKNSLNLKGRVFGTVGLASAPLVVAMPAWILTDLLDDRTGSYALDWTSLGQIWVWSLWALPFLALIAFLAVASIAKPSDRRATVLAVLFGLYAVFVVARLPEVYQVPGWFSLVILVWLMAVVYAADSAAFYVGQRFGNRPLAPNISPKKTWEGFFGGVVAAAIVVSVTFLPILVLSFLQSTAGQGESLSGWQALGVFVASVAGCVGLGVVIATIGTGGDLMASKFKRLAGVKDSGNLFPGHGGLLDRIDSLLPNALLFSSLPLQQSTFVV